jgi:hypothetical protein
MKKPTTLQFFSLEVATWIGVLFLIGINHDWHPRMALSIFFLKMSMANASFALFNMMGVCISAAVGWYPFSSER